MTSFRLNAGRPATVHRGGPPARPATEEAVNLKPLRHVTPASGEFDAYLKCGCTIPWAVIGLLAKGRPILCDLHGPQPSIPKAEYLRLQKEAKQCLPPGTHGQSTLPDHPPF